MSRVSIKDIAREADVSHSTVSRALSDSPLVSAQTREHIKRLARDMGYSPDAQARSLVVGRTQTIGVVVTSITDPFIAEVVQGIESTALDHGYSVILASSRSESERELAAVEMLGSKRVDGVVVTSSRVGDLYRRHLDRLGVPVVLINSRGEEKSSYTYAVMVDNRGGGRQAAAHLLELGHRRMAYVAGPPNHSDDEERLAGFGEVLAADGVQFGQGQVIRGSGRLGGGERALPHLLGLPGRPSAVFCYNDMTAIGLLRAARRAGLDVPDNLSVVGFDNIPFAAYVNPSLTTVAQPMAEMGREAVEMVLALRSGDAPESGLPTDIVVQGRLLVRESTGPLGPGGEGVH